MEIQELTVDEAAHVAGGFFPLAGPIIGGALGGGLGYWGTSDNPSWGGLGISMGIGALSAGMGGFSGAMVGTFGGLYANEIR